MNHESTQLRVKAFRVIDRLGGNDSGWIVIEDVERAQFRTGSSISGGAPTKRMKATMDRSDAWNVLHFLRDAARFPEVRTYEQAADSLDAAVSQAEIRMQELQDWSLRGKVPSWALKERHPIDPKSPPIAVRPAAPGEGPSEEEIQRMIQEVWDFAGGKKLRWKRVGRTPAGRQCDVLTFSGSDEVLVTPTGIELPANQT